MARPARPERSRSALPLRQLSRFCYLINSDMVFGTHRWVWDSAEGKQSPEFTSQKQTQRILDLLMRHANDIAVTLTEVPQYYEPLFLERDHRTHCVDCRRMVLRLRQGHCTRPVSYTHLRAHETDSYLVC